MRGKGLQEYTSRVVGRIFSWALSKTSTPPFYLMDLKLEKIVNAKKLKNFNHKTMQVKSYDLPNLKYYKKKIEKKNHNFFLSYEYVI
jgi:hypothetical protein